MSGASFRLRNITTGGAWSNQSAGGFDCSNGDTIEAQLEDPPVLDANAWSVTVIVASTGAALLLTFPGGGHTTYSPTSPASAFQFTAPASGAHSWLLRSVKNGGAPVTGADGKPDYSVNTKERIVAIRSTTLGLRKGVIAETAQYDATVGWMGALDEIVDAIDLIDVIGDIDPPPTGVTLTRYRGQMSVPDSGKYDLAVIPVAALEAVEGVLTIWGIRTGGAHAGAVGDVVRYRRTFLIQRRAAGNVVESAFITEGTDFATAATWAGGPSDNAFSTDKAAGAYTIQFYGVDTVTLEIGYELRLRRIQT